MFNAEFGVYVLIEFVFALLWWTTDVVNAQHFLIATVVVTTAYLISRGIAKAGKVLEQ